MRPCEKICCISWMCCKKLRDKKGSKKLKIYATLGISQSHDLSWSRCVCCPVGPHHPGILRSHKGTIIEEVPTKVHKQWGAAKSANPGVIMRYHGGTSSMPAEAQYLL